MVDEKTGKDRVYMGAGKYFGEMAIMEATPGIRTASVRAKIDCSLAVLDRDAFHFVLKTFPDFANEIK